MNSENVDTEPSLQMHKLPSVLFLGGRGGTGYTFFSLEGGGGGVGYGGGKGTLCARDNTVCRP